MTVAEVGLGLGATTLSTLELLEAGDSLYVFDFDSVVEEFATDLAKHPLGSKGVVIKGFGNSRKAFDSFNWNFARIIAKQEAEGLSTEIFDAVYLDGAHTFMHTIAACALLKRLLKPGGFLLFDDLAWTLAWHADNHPADREGIEKCYTPEQMRTAQVGMVVDLLIRPDPNYSLLEIDGSTDRRAIFQKQKSGF